ncbi:putative aldouronate transport system permease protein [Paenibacillus sp. yr247]|uniref:carbohydrate ABC transporter permease n=1 Tax=Paenibacillus sp. yr247 TaxID=1761880 RepID=UPI00089084E8|nr:carbohydrate ABC transporter permease [Paenibacillus sp. yr247]SDO19513.1 putative aldouronate transport system permease protein [Paenibacillus sp. yr247]
MRIGETWSSKLLDGVNILLVVVISLLTLSPFLYIVATSISPIDQVLRGGIILWPERIIWDAYKVILYNSNFVRSIYVTLFATIVGTLVNLVMTAFMAYPLAKKRLRGRGFIMFFVLFSMLFSGGMIPTYIIVKSMGLFNTVWALILPGAISAFNLIILKNFFQGIPEELEEAARIDGCRNFGVLFKIVLPLSMPALATFTLFYAVGNWNQFFNAVLYITKPGLWTVQVFLRQMIFQGSTQDVLGQAGLVTDIQVIPTTIQMAAIIIATLPILLVYPFLQKHFAKGVLLGSVKG